MGLLLLWLALLGAETPSPAAPAAPAVALQAVSSTDQVESGDDVTLLVAFTNQSAVKLDSIHLKVDAGGGVSQTETLAGELAPYSTVSTSLTLKLGKVSTGARTLLAMVSYEWSFDKQVHHSTVTAPVRVDVRHAFEEEAKGLPGGTAALLILLFPVIPAFLSFQLAEQ